MGLKRYSEDLVSQVPVPVSAGSGATSSLLPTQSLKASNSLVSLLKHDAHAHERQASPCGPAPLLE